MCIQGHFPRSEDVAGKTGEDGKIYQLGAPIHFVYHPDLKAKSQKPIVLQLIQIEKKAQLFLFSATIARTASSKEVPGTTALNILVDI
ncbi:predicted protein [Sclerotinia sclerotiorum 1980 UF-70]|uniref:Uncharacterized protein n=1 Tax=Sclerotinia sclerotiorum (strain ATCC 18683 / 1980 / Ss-1) TaxID=665079 RepID=A7F9B5_SCLS1|nr:predicted protein [Sclerotinia sclerotiorum 1980 UF-70]EDO00326.1 predicted protein [Sclerotinia sclerotiorum 1980 UF-70]